MSMILLKDLGIFNKEGTTKRRHWYLCECSYCGNSKELLKQNMERDKSCGCATHLKARTSHGQSRSREYQIWADIKDRCDNAKNKRYHRYGGRGITYPDSWKTFELFWEDMKDTYCDDLTIDRTDNDKPYSKDNCKWVTMQEQFQNRSTTKIKRGEIDNILEPMYILNGAERSEQLKILAEKYNVSINTLRTHYNRMLKVKGYK